MKPIRIAIIGYGKIAEDQHVPSLNGNDRFELVATSSRSGQGVAQTFTDWRELIRTVEGKAGTVAFQLSIAPKPDYARGDLRIENRGALGWFCSWANNLIIIRSDIPLSQQCCSLTAEYEVRANDRFHISLSFTRDDVAVLPLLGEQAQERLRLTKQWWREWIHALTADPPLQSATTP
jgi:hypothetical protein